MLLTITIEDTRDGVRAYSTQQHSGVQDNPQVSLAAMWAATMWLHMLSIQKSTHAIIHEAPP